MIDHRSDVRPVGAHAGDEAEEEDAEQRAECDPGDLEGEPEDLVEEREPHGEEGQDQPKADDRDP